MDETTSRIRRGLELTLGLERPTRADEDFAWEEVKRRAQHVNRRRQSIVVAGVLLVLAGVGALTMWALNDRPPEGSVVAGPRSETPTSRTEPTVPDPWAGWASLRELVARGTIARVDTSPTRAALTFVLPSGQRLTLELARETAADLGEAQVMFGATVACSGCGSSYVTVLPGPDPTEYEVLDSTPTSNGEVQRVRDSQTGYEYLVFATRDWVLRALTADIPDDALAVWATALSSADEADGGIVIESGPLQFLGGGGAPPHVSLFADDLAVTVASDDCDASSNEPPARLRQDDGTSYTRAVRCFESAAAHVEIEGPDDAVVRRLYTEVTVRAV